MKIFRFNAIMMIAAVVAMTTFQSCSSDDASTLGGSPEENEEVFMNMVGGSEEVIAVAHMNMGAFMNKSGIKNDPQMGSMIESYAPQLGISTEGKVLVAVEAANIEEAKGFAMFHLESGSKFKNTVKSELGEFESSEAGYDMVKIEGQNAVLAVNDNFGLMVFSTGFMNKDAMTEYIDDLFERGAEDADAGEVAQFVGAGFDMGFMMNSDKAADMIPWDMLAMTGEANEEQISQIESFIAAAKGGWATLGMSFDKGAIRIEGETKSPMATGAGAMLKSGGVDGSFANFISEGDAPAFYMTGGFDLAAMIDLVKGFATDEDMEEVNMMSDLITNVFTGEVSFSMLEIPDVNVEAEIADVEDQFEDLNEEESGEGAEDDMMQANEPTEEDLKNMIVAFGINDKSAIVSVLDTVARMQKSDIEGVYEIPKAGMYYLITKDKFVVTGNKMIAEKIASQGGLSTYAPAESNLSNSIYGEFKFDALKDSDIDRSQAEALRMMDKMTFNVNGGKAVVKFHMKDSSVNSLELIINKALAGGSLMSFM